MVQRINEATLSQEISSVAGSHAGADPRLLAAFLDYLERHPAAPREPEAILTSVMVPLGGMASSETGKEVNLQEWYRRALIEAGNV